MERVWCIAALFPALMVGQDISGDWQGTLKVGANDVRLVVTIAKNPSGGWTAEEVTPDDGSNPVRSSSIILQGAGLKISFDAIRATYDGVLNESKDVLKGALNQGVSMPLNLERATDETSWRRDRTSHKVHFIQVDTDVRLEVVDWGGSGRPIVLLAGGNNHAHEFDKFAPKLTGEYHVYGLSRRGSGASSVPAPSRENYDADRLGDDILAVVTALNLKKPILVGHSLGGQELSSIGSRHAEAVSGLVYLDAGYSYAFDPSGESRAQPQRPIVTAQDAINAGGHRYTHIDVPVLAIYAMPHERGIADPAKRAEADARDLSFQGAMAKAFEKGVPSAKVVWIDHADHYVFRSHEAKVIQEIDAFVTGLPPQ